MLWHHKSKHFYLFKILHTWLLHISDRKTVTPTSRCSESNCVLCCCNCYIMTETDLNGLETMLSLISKLSHLNRVQQVFLVLIAMPVCLRAWVTLFLSSVSSFKIQMLQHQMFRIMPIGTRRLWVECCNPSIGWYVSCPWFWLVEPAYDKIYVL